MTSIKPLLLCATLLAGAATAAGAAPISSRVIGNTTSVATVNVASLARGTGGGGTLPPVSTKGGAPETRVRPLMRAPAILKGDAAALPTVADSLIAQPHAAASSLSLFGFDGLDHYDQRELADAGNQFSLEPPDQALAVGNGYVVELVNNALAIYDTAGNALLAAPVSTNKFFGQASEINRTTGERGPFLSDPRAYYDAATQRFFIVEWATLNFTNGAPLNIAVQFIATSMTSDPTGNWSIVSFETTNSQLPGCPCFGDYQQLGMDSYGVFISMSLFGIQSGSFSGNKTYALSKSMLESGGGSVLLAFPASTSEFTVHPSVATTGGSAATEANGTEYLIESLADLTNTGAAAAMRVFAISNTASLDGSAPSLSETAISVPTERVANGPSGLPPGVQKGGPRPLGGKAGLNEPKPMLNPDDARVSATPVYVNGQLWAATSTAMKSSMTPVTGVAWFDIAVSGGAPALAASVTAQGYIKAPGKGDLLYPEIAMPVSGVGGIGFTITGPSMYPSTAVAKLTAQGAGPIQIAGIGGDPDDGFTAYAAYGGNGIGRWGDYGAAAVDESGALWLANEYIPSSVTNVRTSLANWGTFITQVTIAP